MLQYKIKSLLAAMPRDEEKKKRAEILRALNWQHGDSLTRKINREVGETNSDSEEFLVYQLVEVAKILPVKSISDLLNEEVFKSSVSQ